MNEHKRPNQRIASLFRNGRNQAVRIPVEFELPGDEVLITRDDGRLIIEPSPAVRTKSFLDVIEEYGPLTQEEWPDITDEDLLPLDHVEL